MTYVQNIILMSLIALKQGHFEMVLTGLFVIKLWENHQAHGSRIWVKQSIFFILTLFDWVVLPRESHKWWDSMFWEHCPMERHAVLKFKNDLTIAQTAHIMFFVWHWPVLSKTDKAQHVLFWAVQSCPSFKLYLPASSEETGVYLFIVAWLVGGYC